MKRRNIKYLLVSIILVIPLVLASCIYLNTPPTTSPPASPEITVTPNPTWTLPSPTSQSPLPDFASVVAKVRPSVVAINTEIATFDIFNRPITETGAGSGWIIDSAGHIATNNHVIEGANSITVTLVDGTALPAVVVGADPLNDIAVVKINSAGLTPIPIGDSSKTKIGNLVLAIGNALDLGIGATEGIISRLDVSLSVSSGQTLYGLIQTSAAINPGNSGGPLVNMSGEVIGITSIKLAAVGVEGLGYAISSNTAKPIIEELIQKRYVVRPWLGIVFQSVNPLLVLRYSLPVQEGCFITDVIPGSPADKAGLKPIDVIVSLNGKETKSADDLAQIMRTSKIGDQAVIIFWRGNAKNTAYTVLVEIPPPS